MEVYRPYFCNSHCRLQWHQRSPQRRLLDAKIMAHLSRGQTVSVSLVAMREMLADKLTMSRLEPSGYTVEVECVLCSNQHHESTEQRK